MLYGVRKRRETIYGEEQIYTTDNILGKDKTSNGYK